MDILVSCLEIEFDVLNSFATFLRLQLWFYLTVLLFLFLFFQFCLFLRLFFYYLYLILDFFLMLVFHLYFCIRFSLFSWLICMLILFLCSFLLYLCSFLFFKPCFALFPSLLGSLFECSNDHPISCSTLLAFLVWSVSTLGARTVQWVSSSFRPSFLVRLISFYWIWPVLLLGHTLAWFLPPCFCDGVR